MSSPHHSFDIDLAASYGIECAIMIHHFQYWIRKNRALKRNFHEGRTWMYDKLSEIAANFPYWSEHQIYRIIKKLEEFGVIRKGNFNKSQFDKVLWYAFENEEMFIVLRNRKIDEMKSQNPHDEIAISNTHTIPHTKDRDISEKKPYGSHVKLSDEEYTSLCKKEPKEKVDEIIQEINDHCVLNRPDGYPDYTVAFRTFLRNQNKTQGVKNGAKNKGKLSHGKTENPPGYYIDGKRVD